MFGIYPPDFSTPQGGMRKIHRFNFSLFFFEINLECIIFANETFVMAFLWDDLSINLSIANSFFKLNEHEKDFK